MNAYAKRAFLFALLFAAFANAQSLTVSPAALFFRNPTSANFTQNVSVSGTSGAITATIAYPYAGIGSWLSATVSGSIVAVHVAPSNVSPGVYAAIVVITAGSQTASVAVELTNLPASNGLPANALIATPNTLTFTAPANAPAAAVPPVALINPAIGNYTWTTTSSVPWLTITPSSGTGDAALQISASGNGFQQGASATGLITITSTSGLGPATTKIAVQLNVTASQVATLVVQPTVAAFNAVVGGASQQRALAVYNTGSGSLSWTALKSVSWISVTPASGQSTTSNQNAGTLVVTANPANMAAGLYSSTVTVTAGASTITIPVYLHIVQKAPPTVLPKTLAFTVTQNAVTAQSATLAVTGPANTLFKVTQATGAGDDWFTVTPTSGTFSASGNTLTVTLNPSMIAPLFGKPSLGTYSGVVAISSPGTTQSYLTVSVVMNLVSQQSPPYLQVDQGGLEFSLSPGQALSPQAIVNVSLPGSLSAGQIVTVTPVTSSGGNWLFVNPSVVTVQPTAPQALTVTASAQGLLQGVYLGRLVITAGSNVAPISVPVTMAVGNGTNLGTVASGPLTAAFLNPCDQFISEIDMPNVASVALVDSNGSPVSGATVTVQSSNGDAKVVLTDQGNGVYSTVFPFVFTGPVTLTASAAYAGANGVQTSPAVAVFGEMGPSNTSLKVPFPVIYPGGIVSSASYALSPTPLAAGSLVSLFGQSIAGATAVQNPMGVNGIIVVMGPVDAALLALSPSSGGDQVNVQVPFEVDGQYSADVVVVANGAFSFVQSINIGNVPAAFTASQSGAGTAVLHAADSSLVTSSNPAVAGEFLEIFANGLGALTTPLADGATSTVADSAANDVSVTIGGLPVTVSYAGIAPGFVGLNQINVNVPTGLKSGSNALVISVNGVPSTGSATIPVQ